MHLPLWKRLLSYVSEVHIESSGSEINPHLHVSLIKGRYQLCTEDAIYSFADLYNNFSGAFSRIDFDRLDIRRVLILGFGMGSIPIILEKTFKKNYHYTAVEIDEAVLELAGKYALPAIKSPIEFICADAATFVQLCSEQFDMIAVDVFINDLIPPALQQKDFLEQLKTLLAPNGILLYNHLAYKPSDIQNASTFYRERFRPVFENGTFLEVKGNWMFFNRRDVLT